jgi:phage-related protein
MSSSDKPLVWLASLISTPPMSKEARIEAGYLLRQLQSGDNLGLPHSRPMPLIGRHCHELRIVDENATWRMFYRIDEDAIILAHWVSKKTQKTSQKDIDACKLRFKKYDKDGGKDA